MPVEFVYPSVTAIVPANIALVAGSKSTGGGQALHPVRTVRGRPAAAARQADQPAAGAAGDLCQGPRGYPNPYSGKIQAKVNFDSEPVRIALLRRARDVRPADHVPAQGTGRGDEGDPRRARSALGKPNPSPQLDEARKLAFTAPVDEKQGERQGVARRVPADKKDARSSKRRAQVEEEWTCERERITRRLSSSHQRRAVSDDVGRRVPAQAWTRLWQRDRAPAFAGATPVLLALVVAAFIGVFLLWPVATVLLHGVRRRAGRLHAGALRRVLLDCR